MDLGEIQELTEHHSRGIHEDDLMDTSASKPVPDDEEGDVEASGPENKLTLDNLAKSSDYSRLLLTSFTTWTLV